MSKLKNLNLLKNLSLNTDLFWQVLQSKTDLNNFGDCLISWCQDICILKNFSKNIMKNFSKWTWLLLDKISWCFLKLKNKFYKNYTLKSCLLLCVVWNHKYSRNFLQKLSMIIIAKWQKPNFNCIKNLKMNNVMLKLTLLKKKVYCQY